MTQAFTGERTLMRIHVGSATSMGANHCTARFWRSCASDTTPALACYEG